MLPFSKILGLDLVLNRRFLSAEQANAKGIYFLLILNKVWGKTRVNSFTIEAEYKVRQENYPPPNWYLLKK